MPNNIIKDARHNCHVSEMNIKMGYHCISIRRAKTHKLTMPISVEDPEQ